MFVPLLLIIPAIVAAGLVAYGTDPRWAQYSHGLELIYLTRRLQWPLITFSLVLSFALIGMVIAGKRRAWWLIALGPLLVLMIHRFGTNPMSEFKIVDDPALAAASNAGGVADSDYVVGVLFQGKSYAYPYAALYASPVVVQQNYDKRFILMWSPFANRAMAFEIDKELKPRELEIVSMPANALLIYNSRVGEFINALTGQNRYGQPPIGLRDRIPTVRTTWKSWRDAHPDTIIMPLPSAGGGPLPVAAILPRYPMPPLNPAEANDPKLARLIYIGTPTPLALHAEEITDHPLNTKAGDVPILVFRDAGGNIRAFDRSLDDLTPTFSKNANKKRKNVYLTDSDTPIGWNDAGAVAEGELPWKGRKLKPLPIETDLSWPVMKYWYPQLKIESPGPTTKKAGP